MYMAEVLALRKRIRSLVLKALVATVAGIACGGIWLSLNHDATPAVAVPITHSTPVGGKIEDGVFRSLPDTDEPGLIRWQI